MSTLFRNLLVTLAFFFAVGCTYREASGTGGDGTIEVVATTASALSGADVTRVSVTVGTATHDLTRRGGQWVGVFGQIPYFTDETVSASAYVGAVVKYSGSASVRMDPDYGAPPPRVSVDIVMQQVDAPTAFSDTAPRIDSLSASSVGITTSQHVTLKGVAHDADQGDTLTFAWTGGGTFGPSATGTYSGSGSTVTWTPPSPGSFTLSFVVTDGKGATAGISVGVTVTDGGAPSVDVTASFNAWPIFSGISASNGLDRYGSRATILTATASDPDGDTLVGVYDWTSNCDGSWTDAHAADYHAIEFYDWADHGETDCKFTAHVTDGRGAVGTGVIDLPTTGAGPDFTQAFPSVSTLAPQVMWAPANETVTFVATGTDGRVGSHPLSWTWTFSAGSSISQDDSVPGQSTFTWKSDGNPTTVTATVHNDQGRTAEMSTFVDGLVVSNAADPDFSSFYDDGRTPGPTHRTLRTIVNAVRARNVLHPGESLPAQTITFDRGAASSMSVRLLRPLGIVDDLTLQGDAADRSAIRIVDGNGGGTLSVGNDLDTIGFLPDVVVTLSDLSFIEPGVLLGGSTYVGGIAVYGAELDLHRCVLDQQTSVPVQGGNALYATSWSANDADGNPTYYPAALDLDDVEVKNHSVISAGTGLHQSAIVAQANVTIHGGSFHDNAGGVLQFWFYDQSPDVSLLTGLDQNGVGPTFSNNEADAPVIRIYGNNTLVPTNAVVDIDHATFSNNTNTYLTGPGAVAISGIFASATIEHSSFSNNDGASGGAIQSDFRSTVSGNTVPLTISGCTFTGNHSPYDGGAIDANAALSVTDSTFADNHAAAHAGGAVYCRTVDMVAGCTFAGSYFHDNVAATEGGAVYASVLSAASQPVSITGSSFVNNKVQPLVTGLTSTVDDRGGAVSVQNNGSALLVTNVTFYGNAIAPPTNGQGQQGSTLRMESGPAHLSHVTMVAKSDAGPPPLCSASTPAGSFTVQSSILESDVTTTDFQSGVHKAVFDADVHAKILSLGYVIHNDTQVDTNDPEATAPYPGFTPAGTDVVDTSLAVGPPSPGVGPSQATPAVQPDTVDGAVDAVPAASCVDAAGNPLTVDQWGRPRPANVTCDVGAIELHAAE